MVAGAVETREDSEGITKLSWLAGRSVARELLEKASIGMKSDGSAKFSGVDVVFGGLGEADEGKAEGGRPC